MPSTRRESDPRSEAPPGIGKTTLSQGVVQPTRAWQDAWRQSGTLIKHTCVLRVDRDLRPSPTLPVCRQTAPERRLLLPGLWFAKQKATARRQCGELAEAGVPTGLVGRGLGDSEGGCRQRNGHRER